MAQARTGSKQAKQSPKARLWERPILLVTKWSQWWVLPFLISTICVVLLQVGPRPLHTAVWGTAAQKPNAGTEANKQPEQTKQQGEQPNCTIWANPSAANEKKPGEGKGPDEPQTPGYRPFQEVVLLEAHDTATEEIRERISQEHVYFALKFSIIGAILIVLFRLTRQGNIDEFLQMRRAALFFSAALLACAIVDTRLRFNALVMETLGEWLKNQFEPCMTSAMADRGVNLDDFEFWEKYFKKAENSPVMATLRYFSLSLTALLHAVYVYLFIILPTRAHRPTLWLVFWTSLFLQTLLLPIGASYCPFRALTALPGAVEQISLDPHSANYWLECSAIVAGISLVMVGSLFVGKWIHMKHFLDRSLATTLRRFSIRLKHLEDKAKLVREEYLIAKRGGGAAPSAGSLEHELKQCWEEAAQLASAMRKLIRRWHAWRKRMHMNTPHGLQEVREVIVHSPFFNDGQSSVVTRVAFDALSPAENSSPKAEEPGQASSVVPPPEELPDLEEYLWNLYLAERNRRHAVAPRHVGYQTGKSWWQPT